MRLSFTLLVLLFATPSYASKYLLAQPNATSPPSITISNEIVRAEGMTPAGEVILFTASLESDGGTIRRVTGAKAFADSDGDGVITFTGTRPVPLRSIWIGIDFDSGRYAIGSPPGYKVTVLPFPETDFRRDAGGIVGLFDREHLSAEMLVVRPKEGAWHLRAFDGGRGDADTARNGKLVLIPAEASVIRGAPPPQRLKKGDLVAIIDPGRMEIYVTQVDR